MVGAGLPAFRLRAGVRGRIGLRRALGWAELGPGADLDRQTVKRRVLKRQSLQA
jgi:hypothetical protein